MGTLISPVHDGIAYGASRRFTGGIRGVSGPWHPSIPVISSNIVVKVSSGTITKGTVKHWTSNGKSVISRML